VYLRNRWYDPQSGRFLTQDPIGLAGGVNLYAQGGNRGLAFTDTQCHGELLGQSRVAEIWELRFAPGPDGTSALFRIAANGELK